MCMFSKNTFTISFQEVYGREIEAHYKPGSLVVPRKVVLILYTERKMKCGPP